MWNKTAEIYCEPSIYSSKTSALLRYGSIYLSSISSHHWHWWCGRGLVTIFFSLSSLSLFLFSSSTLCVCCSADCRGGWWQKCHSKYLKLDWSIHRRSENCQMQISQKCKIDNLRLFSFVLPLFDSWGLSCDTKLWREMLWCSQEVWCGPDKLVDCFDARWIQLIMCKINK